MLRPCGSEKDIDAGRGDAVLEPNLRVAGDIARDGSVALKPEV